MTTIPVITLETINRNILNHEVRAAFEQTRSLHGSSLPFGAMARSFPFSYIAFWTTLLILAAPAILIPPRADLLRP